MEHRFLIKISFLIVIIRSCTSQNEPIYRVNDRNVIWSPTSNESIIIETDEGYKLAVTIQFCDIDGSNKEFATISTGKAIETYILSYTLPSTTSFFFNYDRLYATFTGTDASNLSLIFSRMGEALTTTTTEVTSTTVFLPTPSANDTYELSVHLSGLHPYEYLNPEVLMEFKQMLANMASDYCEQDNFDLIDDITTDNVQIIEIVRCTKELPACDPCVLVKFALPIHIREDPDLWTGYQLNAEHLEIMWERYSEKYLSNGITTCVEPNFNSWIMWVVLIFAGISIVVFIMLLVLQYVSVKFSVKAGRKRRRISDQQSIVQSEERHSSLNPHYLQEMPPLFDNTYLMYNPHVNHDFKDHKTTMDIPVATDTDTTV